MLEISQNFFDRASNIFTSNFLHLLNRLLMKAIVNKAAVKFVKLFQHVGPPMMPS